MRIASSIAPTEHTHLATKLVWNLCRDEIDRPSCGIWTVLDLTAALQDLYFTPFGDMESALTGAPDMHPQLMAQILPHVQATAQLGTHCTTLVDLLLDKHMGIAPDAAIVAELATALEQLSAPETPRPTGYLTLDFMAKSIALLTDQPLPEPHMD